MLALLCGYCYRLFLFACFIILVLLLYFVVLIHTNPECSLLNLELGKLPIELKGKAEGNVFFMIPQIISVFTNFVLFSLYSMS
jgi:hypothetical protein